MHLKLRKQNKHQAGQFDLKAAFALMLFIASALVPIGIYYFIVEKDLSGTAEVDKVFPSSIAIKTRGTFFKAVANPKLDPIADSDFILVSWFKLVEVPTADQEMVLLSKSDSTKRVANGYSIRLIRAGSYFRPLVLWHDPAGKGGKYEFSDIRIDPNIWYGFVLSYSQPNILGLHLIEQKEDAKPIRSLLGAYQLKVPVMPSTNVDLMVGAARFGTFRGAIGPVGVLVGKDLTRDIKQVVKTISENPQELHRYFDNDEVVFFTINGKDDLSSSKTQIITSDNLSN
jgi:hypothetical protein